MYFDFDTKQLHRTGVFGYINEVMATTNMDTYHGVTVARREFYPNTANYTKSLFKMAALQQIDYPMANAGVATAVLLLHESEILKYGELQAGTTGIYKLVVDNDMVITAGSIPFMLDYPINILFKTATKTTKNQSDTMGDYRNKPGVVTFTNNDVIYNISYDTTYKNSQNTQTTKYLKHRVVNYGGEKLLIIAVGLRQCTRTVSEQVINQSPTMTNVTLDFPFEGDLCGFDVFYTPNGSDQKIQLVKLPINANPVNESFCMYSLTSDNILKIHFPSNNYFTPKFNSVITVHIYTTLGEDGNFRLFNGDLQCSPSSEKYDYNRVLAISGQIQGSCSGGYSMPTFEIFRQKVVRAYATNQVKCTEQDLQMYFDDMVATTNNKILFFKRRDDVFERLFGAFMLLRDLSGDIIPTNSLVTNLRIEEDFNDEEKTAFLYGTNHLPTGLSIKPGGVWRYSVPSHRYYDGDGYTLERAYEYYTITALNYSTFADQKYKVWETNASDGETVEKEYDVQWVFEDGTVRTLTMDTTDPTHFAGTYIGCRCYAYHSKRRLDLHYDITDTTEEMLYTNPFLITISRNRNSVAFYINSFDSTIALDMTEVNNDSFVQFIDNSLSVQRNALLGENFYKLSIKLQPTTVSENLRKLLVLTKDELDLSEQSAYANIDSDIAREYLQPAEIRAQYSGSVVGYIHKTIRITRCKRGCNQTTTPHTICPTCGFPTVDRSVSVVFQVIKYPIATNPGLTPADMIHYQYTDGLPEVDEFGNILNYIQISPSVDFEFEDETTTYSGEKIYKSQAWYDPIYAPGDSFTQNTIIATRKCQDQLVLRTIGEISGLPGLYLPFYIEDYDSSIDVYTLSAYIATNDAVTDDGKLTITGGLFHDESVSMADSSSSDMYTHIPYTDPITIDPYNLIINISTYLRYDDVYGDYSTNPYGYVRRHTLTNVYSNKDTTKLAFLERFDFIRATMLEHDVILDENNKAHVNDPYRLTIKEIPMVRASWAKKSNNLTQLLTLLKTNNDFINETFDLLENNYTIDMKFYNTYGKSRFYRIGIGDPAIATNEQQDTLERVNIKLKFGIKISTLSDSTMFKERFVAFVREYIEDLNATTRDGDSINMMDMVTQISNNFDEIERLEYYGIDDRDASRAQFIDSWSTDEIEQLGYKEYIPEFINVYLIYDTSTESFVPDIEITDLD